MLEYKRSVSGLGWADTAMRTVKVLFSSNGPDFVYQVLRYAYCRTCIHLIVLRLRVRLQVIQLRGR